MCKGDFEYIVCMDWCMWVIVTEEFAVEIIAVCSQIHTKQINTLCGQNVELLNVKLAVHIVTTGL